MKLSKWVGCVLSVLILAGCAGGMTAQQKRAFSGMTEKQRDLVGRQAAAQMRQESGLRDTDDFRITAINYRAKDNTFVYRIVLKKIQGADKIDAYPYTQETQAFRQRLRRDACSAKLRDFMVYGRYALEYQIYTRNGKRMMAPMRITADHC